MNQVAAITRENPVVMAQIEKTTKDQAMKGNLPGAVQAAVVRTMSSHGALATLLLSKDRQALPILESVIYEILKRGETLSLHVINDVELVVKASRNPDLPRFVGGGGGHRDVNPPQTPSARNAHL